jgi:hypothetical protein
MFRLFPSSGASLRYIEYQIVNVITLYAIMAGIHTFKSKLTYRK